MFEWLANISIETQFIIFSAFIAIVIWFEGETLKQTKGKMPKSLLFHLGSLLDSLWFLAACCAFYFLDFQSIDTSVPVVYMIYTIFGFVYGTTLMGKDGIPDSPDDIVIPKAYINYNQSFALVFFVLCILVLYLKFTGTCLPFSLNIFS